MAICQNSNERVFGAATVLELAMGCPDVVPAEVDWKALGAGTSKGLDFAPNSVTSDADDTAGWVENITTNADATVSFEGEVRKHDKLDQFGYGNLVKYFADEINAKRQPTVWVRMEVGPIEFTGYMVISNLTPADGGSNDIITFSVEFKVSDGTTVKIENVDAVPVTGVTLTPVTSTGVAGGTGTFTVTVAPAEATNKAFTVATTDAAKATATVAGNVVTVTRVAAGSAQIIVNTVDGNFVATHTATIT